MREAAGRARGGKPPAKGQMGVTSWAFMEGMVVAMLCGVLLSVVSFVTAFAVKEKRLPSADNE